jgi:hypothetical protein
MLAASMAAKVVPCLTMSFMMARGAAFARHFIKEG